MFEKLCGKVWIYLNTHTPKPIRDKVWDFLVDYNPRLLLDYIWKRDFGYTVDWKHPRDLNEKIEWMIVYSDTSLWSKLADKFQVRDFVTKKGYAHLLVPLLGVYNSPDELDYDKLPERFVLKCNHDANSTMIVDQTANPDFALIASFYRERLAMKFGYCYCQPHYNKIQPRLLAETLLEDQGNEISSSLIDYKVWCFNGKPHVVFVAFNRTKSSLTSEIHAPDWTLLPDYRNEKSLYIDGRGKVPKPDCLDEMLKAASVLSEGFPQVRVDFFVANGKLYLSEMTFTSANGRMTSFSKKAQIKMGRLVDIGK